MAVPGAPKILIHIGTSGVRFGQVREDVRARLGEPRGLDADSVPGWETWEYSHLEVTFDEDADWRCTNLATGHPDAIVNGTRVMGLPFPEALKLAPTWGLGICVPDLTSAFGPDLDFPDIDLSISFYEGYSWRVRWSARIDSADEYQWPSGFAA